MHAQNGPPIHFLEEPSVALARWCDDRLVSAPTPFEAARAIARRLGVHRDGSATQFGFWIPQTDSRQLEHVYMELFTPLETIDLNRPVARASFARKRIPLNVSGEFAWGVLSGLQAGDKARLGALYQVQVGDGAGGWRVHRDPLAWSIPFGSFAPAEYYDVERLLANRSDGAYFAQRPTQADADGVARVHAPANILQVHVNTASPSGTFAGLTDVFRQIAAKLRQGQPLSAAEQCFSAYDAVQLMPIEPVIEYEHGPPFWRVLQEADDHVVVQLAKPDMTNWGYDVVIGGSPAVNPATLETRRPDEFLEFLETLHTFPGKPIQLILDVVYGHADNQAQQLLEPAYFAGSNMYGQNLNFEEPMVRAILLEMQRRKANYGVDGVRVDGAQDFKTWNPETGVIEHDDDFLRLMNDLELDVAGRSYRPWMIFEDGRPWPDPDWELSSTYREVTRQMPNVVQWVPLTFAHNTPFLVTFWITKWWRIKEIAAVGHDWVTGCANHDTLRRGTQAPLDARINTHLGDSLPQILRQAYDHPASRLFDYGLMPGVPMEFINANMRAPWSFVRNTDYRYAVKVVAEEARFLAWALQHADFEREGQFERLKALGFESLATLKQFTSTLAYALAISGNDLEQCAQLLGATRSTRDEALHRPAGLRAFARAWMDDVHAYCNVWNQVARLDAGQTEFMRTVREFRHQRPWLRQNFGAGDRLEYLRPMEGAVLFYGLRHNPHGAEQILFIANMEGKPRTITPLALPSLRLPEDGWRIALCTPGLDVSSVTEELTLSNSQGVLFTRQPG